MPWDCPAESIPRFSLTRSFPPQYFCKPSHIPSRMSTMSATQNSVTRRVAANPKFSPSDTRASLSAMPPRRASSRNRSAERATDRIKVATKGAVRTEAATNGAIRIKAATRALEKEQQTQGR